MCKKFLLLAMALALVLAAAPVGSGSPNGTISFGMTSTGEWDPQAAVPVSGLGINGIAGVLSFAGRPYTIRLQGLETAIPGVRAFSAKGDVYHLKSVTDLAGTYHKAAAAGITFPPGEPGLVVQNDKGVVINFRVVHKRLVGVMRTIGEALKQEGVPLDLMPGGLTIKFVS